MDCTCEQWIKAREDCSKHEYNKGRTLLEATLNNETFICPFCGGKLQETKTVPHLVIVDVPIIGNTRNTVNPYMFRLVEVDKEILKAIKGKERKTFNSDAWAG